MSTLWTFGCSFTANYDPIEGLHYPFENIFDKYKAYRGGNFPKIWPELLSEKLKMDLMNCAKGGSSNYKILNQFFDVCDIIEKNDIVIFGWTSVLRFRVANFSEDIFNEILPNNTNFSGDDVSTSALNEIVYNRSHILWVNEVRNWIRMINVFAESKGFEVYHWTSDETIFDQFSTFIDEKKYIIIDESTNETGKTNLLGHINMPMFYNGELKGRIRDETNCLISDDHQGEFGHKIQCEYFYNHIKKHSTLNI